MVITMDDKIIYQTKNEPKRVYPICLSLLVVGGGLFMATAVFPYFRWLFQITGICLVAACLQIATRYILTSYIYVLDSDSLFIYRVVGKKRTEVCCVYLESGYALIKNPQMKLLTKKYGRFILHYNYCSVMSPKDSSAFLFTFNDKNAIIIFQPDNSFIQSLTERSGINYE